MKRLVVASLAMLALADRPASAHQLDEYLQASRLAIAKTQLRIEMSLTPGVAVAPTVFALIDRNGDGQVSSTEIDSYARELLRDVVLSVDGQPVALTIAGVAGATWEAMRDGAGTIRVEALASVRAMSAGRHQIRLVNTHQSGLSVYLVNALAPADPDITIAAQRRDVLQHGIELDVDIASWSSSMLWTALFVCAFATLARHHKVQEIRVFLFSRRPLDPLIF
jgi:hypothetical protein